MTIEDQPPPIPSTGDVWLDVQRDMEQRRLIGIARYGTPLQVDNGRDHLIDAYQEHLDEAVYLRAAIERRQRAVPLLAKELAELYGGADWDKLLKPQRDAWEQEARAILEKIL